MKTARDYFNMACRDLGLEHPATIGIGRCIDAAREGRILAGQATDNAKIIYNKAMANIMKAE